MYAAIFPMGVGTIYPEAEYYDIEVYISGHYSGGQTAPGSLLRLRVLYCFVPQTMQFIGYRQKQRVARAIWRSCP
jgi:hypothetical protein